jgi:GNAT superfamily N-acetyltransferase
MLDLLQRCARDMMERRGFDNWARWLDETADWMREQIATLDVYAVLEDDQLVATFTVQYLPMRYMDAVVWREPDASAIYLRRLAVLPEYQGHGIGAWCIDAFERMARDNGFKTARLDAHYSAATLHAYYERFGYQPRGLIMLDTVRGVVCFEKRL